jgi:hypothetical protein
MVQAGSLNRGFDRRIVFIIAAVALVVVAAGAYFLVGSSSDTDEKPAVSRPVDQDIVTQIENLPFEVSQPEKIPTEFMRTEVKVVSASATDSGCEEVVQLHSLTDEEYDENLTDEEFLEKIKEDELAGFMDVYVYASDCSYPRPDDAEPYNVGDYSGWISDSDPELSVLYELTVNQALVRVNTSLDRKTMEQVLERFVPFSTTPPVDSVAIANT